MADIVLKTVQRRLPKGSHKGRQAAHNDATHKYDRQRIRTTSNKAKAVARHLVKHPNDLQAKVNLAVG
jgi:hypothetical protein